jgi:hypothetical protein
MQPLSQKPCTLEELAGEIEQNKVLTLNRGRIITTWGDPAPVYRKAGRVIRQWDENSAGRLVLDILDLLADDRLGLVIWNGKKWELTEKFDPYERYVLLTPDGKQLTHLRLREKETRRSRVKLNEARMMLLDAARLTREAGVESQEVTEFFQGLQRMLSNENVFERKPRGNGPRVITPDQPPNLPNLFVACSKCDVPKPQTREFYEVYWDNGKWYWRTDCKDCRKKIKQVKSAPKYLEHLEKIRAVITKFHEETGYYPTIKQVSKRAGVQGNAVRAAWRMLAEQDKEFPPVPMPLSRA